MAVTKTEDVSARVPSDVNAALAAAAQAERRSVASMPAVMVLSHCRDHGITAVPAARPPGPAPEGMDAATGSAFPCRT